MARSGGPMAREAVARLDLKPTDAVIEIGFGPGLGLEILAKTVTEGRVTGVDPSETMHRQASARNAKAIGEKRVTLIEGTAVPLPFADNSFDTGLAIDNMHFWPDRLAGLRELRRVLRPGARFVCAFTPPSGGTKHGLIDLFAEAGYKDIDVKDSEAGFSFRAAVDK